MTVVIKLKQAALFLAAITAIAVLSFMSYVSGSYAVFFGGTVRKIPIYCVGREDKYISITFDCAWGTDYTDSILNALRVSGVAATFFMVEFWAEKYPDYVKKIDEAGCEIGTHSSTHSYMSKLSESQIREELLSSSQAIAAITGKAVELFRPPYGDYDNLLISTAEDMGLYTIQWDVDSLDWKGLSATDIAMRVINKVQSGSIILMHNNGEHTAEAVPIILQTLINSGYKFVPVGELIYRDNYTIDSSGKQISA
ncbi:MAG: polysaccharide deacetylase family protein [Clostridia bacterium]|nr:polysaccharide deacetylase family protein [Clostridia bacterium]